MAEGTDATGVRDGVDEAAMARLETELAVLARTLESLSRRSKIHRELDRASYLIARTLSAQGVTSIGALAERLGLDATTVTRQIATMDAAGLVARKADPDDARVVLVVLTPRGERKMREVQAARAARIDALVADWSPSERTQFASLLARFNEALLASRD
jgi:DNA-binding MarR family transcriptional regulator